MDDRTDLIRCGRCVKHLPPESFAPASRKTGSYCRPCAAAYQRERFAAIRENRYDEWVSRRRSVRSLLDYDSATGKRPSGRRWDDLKALVFAEESDCWLCGEPVDKTLTGRHSDGPTVDHVHELSEGGDFWDRANCRLAHQKCNAKRGAKLGRKRQLARWDDMQRELAELRERVADLEYQLRVARGAA